MPEADLVRAAARSAGALVLLVAAFAFPPLNKAEAGELRCQISLSSPEAGLLEANVQVLDRYPNYRNTFAVTWHPPHDHPAGDLAITFAAPSVAAELAPLGGYIAAPVHPGRHRKTSVAVRDQDGRLLRQGYSDVDVGHPEAAHPGEFGLVPWGAPVDDESIVPIATAKSLDVEVSQGERVLYRDRFRLDPAARDLIVGQFRKLVEQRDVRYCSDKPLPPVRLK